MLSETPKFTNSPLKGPELFPVQWCKS